MPNSSSLGKRSWPVHSIMPCIIISPLLFSGLSIVWCKSKMRSHCFSFSGKPKALRLKNTASSPFSSSEQESSYSSSSKLENSTSSKSITPVSSTTTTSTTSPQPAPAVRPHRARQEVLKPVVLVLPTIHFPDFFPPQHNQARFNSSFNYARWRSPSQTLPVSRSSGGLSKDVTVKSRPLF